MPHRRADAADRHLAQLLDARIIGQSPPMRRLKELLPRVARSRSSVLIHGESGTGKELVARAIHTLSLRSAAPFVAENCAALPEGVIESELFGHVRGSFTGADRDHEGLIALAHGGTLFLDEVGDLPPRIQAKLLRVIQEGEFRPVGGRLVKRSDFRVVAATHRDLASMVERGSFRGDLFYRLNVIQVRVPPLRERIEDIPLLVEKIIEQLCQRDSLGLEGRGMGPPQKPVQGPAGGERAYLSGSIPRAGDPRPATSRTGPSHGSQRYEGIPQRDPGGVPAGEPSDGSRSSGEQRTREDDLSGEEESDVAAGLVPPVFGVSREAMEMLLRYPWPGNVRELQNVVEAALVLAAGGVIGVGELPERIIDHALSEPEGTALGEGRPHERVMIEMALARFSGDKAKAARFIGWSRPKLYRLMARYGISLRFGKGGA